MAMRFFLLLTLTLLWAGCESSDSSSGFEHDDEEPDPQTLLQEERATVINQTATDIVVTSTAIDDESVGQTFVDILGAVFFNDPLGEKETEPFSVAIPPGEQRSIRIVVSDDDPIEIIHYRNATHYGQVRAADGAIITIVPEMLTDPLPGTED